VPESGSTAFDDAVFGRVEFANSEIEDFVLLRSDSVPTYHLSVVVDDIDMRMTHIVHGADHLSNTLKQVMLYKALGASLPIFAHAPLILGPDKTGLSKRHGATSVIAYKEEGIAPEAFRYFLALLGWTPADSSREIMSNRELIGLFDMSGIRKSNEVFDRGKPAWFNTEYMRADPIVLLLPLIEEEWEKAGLIPFQASRTAMESTVDLVKPRARNLKDFATLFRAYFSDDYESDPAAVQKFLKDEPVREMLVKLAERYEKEAVFLEESTEKVLRDFAAEKNVKAAVLINGARVALTGQGVAPSLFAVMTNLGGTHRGETEAREGTVSALLVHDCHLKPYRDTPRRIAGAAIACLKTQLAGHRVGPGGRARGCFQDRVDAEIPAVDAELFVRRERERHVFSGGIFHVGNCNRLWRIQLQNRGDQIIGSRFVGVDVKLWADSKVQFEIGAAAGTQLHVPDRRHDHRRLLFARCLCQSKPRKKKCNQPETQPLHCVASFDRTDFTLAAARLGCATSDL
jgi:hypothetical protein